jgi:2-polyprenyl-6-methoxyphenol hydroxylase-like FAD-dependent oxidoreductase
MMFVSHETERRISIGIAFPVEGPVDRSNPKEVAQVHQLAIAFAHNHLPAALAELIVDQCLARPGGAPLQVNCRHRREVLQYDPAEQILRLGDAWHAVSPYAGAGANMALVDGCRLGRVAMAPSQCAKEVVELTKRWNAVFKREATVIGFAHGHGQISRACRYALLRIVPLTTNPSKRLYTLASCILVLAVVAWACGMVPHAYM